MDKLKISVVVTVRNEEKTIKTLLESLVAQTHPPLEIVVVDGGSTDGTIELIKEAQSKNDKIKLIISQSSRARGRNLGIESTKSELIAITDAGCIADKDWLRYLAFELGNPETEVIAGFYSMVGKNAFENAESYFLGTRPEKYNRRFLPSTRSIAFKRGVWSRVGGFPENLKGTAEDTVFVANIIKSKIKITQAPKAIVYWQMPKNLIEFFNKVAGYARGDVQSKNLLFPGKGLGSHNIKVLTVFARYILLVAATMYFLKRLGYLAPTLPIYFLILYLINAFQKGGVWGIVLQFTSDFAVMLGFIRGIIDLWDTSNRQ